MVHLGLPLPYAGSQPAQPACSLVSSLWLPVGPGNENIPAFNTTYNRVISIRIPIFYLTTVKVGNFELFAVGLSVHTEGNPTGLHIIYLQSNIYIMEIHNMVMLTQDKYTFNKVHI